MDAQLMRAALKQSCSADNITIMRKQKLNLMGIQAMIQGNIRDAEQAKDEAAFYNNMLFGLQLVKTTCDVIIGVAGELVPGGGKVVKTVYSAAVPVAELGTNAVLGNTITKADLARTGNAVIGSGLSYRLSGTPYDGLVGNRKATGDLLINATAMDEEAVMVSLLEHKAQLTDWALETAKQPGTGKYVPVFSIGVEIVKAGVSYKNAYMDWKKGDMDATFDSGLAMSRRQLTQISTRISDLDKALTNCGAQDSQFLSPSTRLLTQRHTGPALRPGR